MFKEAVAKLVGDVRSPLQMLNESTFEFQLTGSRRFGDAKANSDYDFFVRASGPVLDFLHDNGFKLVTNEDGYSDIAGVQVFRKLNVDVQVREQFDKFESVNRFLDTHPSAYTHLKSVGKNTKEAKLLWVFLERVVSDEV